MRHNRTLYHSRLYKKATLLLHTMQNCHLIEMQTGFQREREFAWGWILLSGQCSPSRNPDWRVGGSSRQDFGRSHSHWNVGVRVDSPALRNESLTSSAPIVHIAEQREHRYERLPSDLFGLLADRENCPEATLACAHCFRPFLTTFLLVRNVVFFLANHSFVFYAPLAGELRTGYRTANTRSEEHPSSTNYSA